MTHHLKDFLQFLKLNRNASAHTVRAYGSDLTQFLGCVARGADVKVGDLDPARLDRQAIRAFMAELHRERQSRATAARKLAAVRTFLRYMSRERIIADNPGALDQTPLGRRDRAILELFYASGLRVSELAGLDLEDVNLGAKMTRVLGKGGKERIIPFNSRTAKAIRAY